MEHRKILSAKQSLCLVWEECQSHLQKKGERRERGAHSTESRCFATIPLAWCFCRLSQCPSGGRACPLGTLMAEGRQVGSTITRVCNADTRETTPSVSMKNWLQPRLHNTVKWSVTAAIINTASAYYELVIVLISLQVLTHLLCQQPNTSVLLSPLGRQKTKERRG